MYARRFADVFSPAALIARASFFSLRSGNEHPSSNRTYLLITQNMRHASRIRFERRWVHGHSGGVYPVPFRTRKSRPPASVLLLWCESPRERQSLCPSSFTGLSPYFFQSQCNTLLVIIRLTWPVIENLDMIFLGICSHIIKKDMLPQEPEGRYGHSHRGCIWL